MRLKREEHTGQWELLINDDAFAHFINDWPQWLHPRRYNWLTFRPFLAEFEWDAMCPGWEVTLVLFGLGLRLRVNRDWEGTEIADITREAESEEGAELEEFFKGLDGEL